MSTGIAMGGQGGRMHPLTAKKNAKNWETGGENQEKEEKSQEKEEKLEGSFTLPLLTEWAGYATDCEIMRIPFTPSE